ncbi:MAG: amidohydrolase family protein [Christensenellales bacterium]|jgi:predicted TIM-barrel fold metal-dependent hydrolase
MRYKIIDAHAHIFPDKIASAASQNIGDFYSIPMLYDGSAGVLLDMCAKHGVEKTIVSSVATKVHQVRSINTFICESCRNPAFAGLISLHPDLTPKEIDREIEFALANGLKGVKLHSDFQRFDIDSPKAENIYSAVAGVLPVLFHVGDPNKDFSHPKRLVKVLKRYPKLKAVAAHLGGYTKWDEVACYAEVDCRFDSCSALCFMDRERGARLIEFFGADKVMFGSDYPMSGADKERDILLSLGLGQEKEEKILRENAREFYNL